MLSTCQISICGMDSAIETVTSFCVSCARGHIWRGKASGSAARTVFPIHPSLSHAAHAPSCVSCVPWLVILPLAPVVCVPAAGSSPERLFYPPWTACWAPSAFVALAVPAGSSWYVVFVKSTGALAVCVCRERQTAAAGGEFRNRTASSHINF